MQAYPALDGKVIYAEIDDGESYTILTNTIGSGVKDSADMALTQNGADLKTYLLDDGLSYAYFPKALEDVVDEQYRNPAVVTFVNSLLITTTPKEASASRTSGLSGRKVERQGLLQRPDQRDKSASTSDHADQPGVERKA